MQNRRLLSADEIDGILGSLKKELDEFSKPYMYKEFRPVTEHIYIVSKGDAVYKELIKMGARGVCRVKDGYIFFRDDIDLTPHLIIHEFVHRMSRNRKKHIILFPLRWVEGINLSGNRIYCMNEIITEMITVEITGVEEKHNPYTVGLAIMRNFSEKVGKQDLIDAYFSGNLGFFKHKLKKHFKDFVNNYFYLIVCYREAWNSNYPQEYMDKARLAGMALKLIVNTKIVLDNGLDVCDDNEYETEIVSPMGAVKYIPAKLFRLIWRRCRGKPKIGVARWPITLCPTFMAKRTAFMRC